MTLSNIALFGVPIDCTGNAGGCERAPTVLHVLGFGEAIGAKIDYNDLAVRIDDKKRDEISGVIGINGVINSNPGTKETVEGILRSGLKPIILGGCCSYVMGAIAAARRVYGRVGLIYVDGHMELYNGKTSPGGECSDMPLAFILGKGPSVLDRLMETSTLVAREDVSLVGYRDRYLAAPQGSLLPEQLGGSFHHMDADLVRTFGLGKTAELLIRKQNQGACRYWLHFDWDVLDEKALPLADYLMPNGFDWDDLVTLVGSLVQSPNMIGLSMACYNPDKDPDLLDGKRIVNSMRKIFDNN